MKAPSLRPYEDPADHKVVADIIRRRSTNPADVREVALNGLDLSLAREILDLGCGFGFMAEAIGRHASKGARLTGVDACPANEKPFVDRVNALGLEARFECRMVEPPLPWPAAHFDLVVCSYSLYFFAEALPEIARILKPRGLLVAITHSQGSCAGLLDAAGIGPKGAGLGPVVASFSAENGHGLLQEHFAEVECIGYPNRLRFTTAELAELLTYVRLKLPLLAGDGLTHAVIPPAMLRAVSDWLAAEKTIWVAKDDACFRCRGPRCH